MAGFWKRWAARHVNVLSFWFVLAVVAGALALAAWLLMPPTGRQRRQPPSPASPWR